MHPSFYSWWKSRHDHHDESGCGAGAGGGHGGHGGGCGSHGGGHGDHESHGHGPGPGWRERWDASGSDGGGDFGGGAFGVRRPLRFLAYKLDLDEKQVGELAKLLNELKTERAQADVDGRRTIAGFADAVAGPAFDEPRAADAASLRVKSAERLRDAVLKAMRGIHALLTDDQRTRLAYLIRTGVVTL